MNKITAALTIIVATVVLFSDYTVQIWRNLGCWQKWVWAIGLTLAIGGGICVSIAPIIWDWGNWLITNF